LVALRARTLALTELFSVHGLLKSLETDLLVEHITRLKAGEAVDVPRYDFCSHSRLPETSRQEPRRVILVEGILIFCHEALLSQLDVKVFVDAPADVRLMRRIHRDCEERGRTPADVLEQYDSTVRPAHAAWVEPSKARADLIVPSDGHQQLQPAERRPFEKAIEVLARYARALVND
jgi:uridine kinase